MIDMEMPQQLVFGQQQWQPPISVKSGGEVDKAWFDYLYDQELLKRSQQRKQESDFDSLHSRVRKYPVGQLCQDCPPGDQQQVVCKGLCNRCYQRKHVAILHGLHKPAESSLVVA